ncbi:hypothetical protein GGS20DRAFT_508534 [Poronia punctata]|nr:hypothetical protein GGS20DRAFT_508534 [Poronia punctata]
MQFKTGILGLLAAGSAMAHMTISDPIALTHKDNPNTLPEHIDYSITSPLEPGQFPCKGHLDLLGTSEATPVKTYSPGQKATMAVEGSAIHNGGSCQISLSYDKGQTFKVIKSYIGNCPTFGGVYDFTIPEDAPEGDEVVFAWTWVNKTGNREFYMSCSVVSIKGGNGAKRSSLGRRGVAFDDLPTVFEANLGGEYCTKEGVDTVYPEPGPDVVNEASSPGPAIFCDSGEPVPTDGSGSEPAPTSSGTGGVFLPTGGADVSTTLSTVTTSAPVSSSSVPVTTTSGPSVTSTSTSQPTPTGGASGVKTGACTPEGAWNCIDGTNFQRCGSGQWSVVMQVAAGTSCTIGVSDILKQSRLQ